MLGIKRQRGEAPDIRIEAVDGTSYIFSPTGAATHVSPIVKRSDDGKSFQIRARNIDEAKLLLRQVHKRYPTFDLAKVLAGAEFSSFPFDSVMKTSFQFGGDLAGRSMVKTALALAHSLGVPPSACDLAIQYLRSALNAEPSLADHFISDLVVDRPPRLFNCIAVFGDTKKRRLIGYVEYFGVCRWVIHLSSSYDGPEVQGVYCLDAISGEELPINVNLNLSDQYFLASLANLTSDEQKRVISRCPQPRQNAPLTRLRSESARWN
jgi:hypothetical protein